MKKYEYKMMEMSRGVSVLSTGKWKGDFDINALGNEGWELVSILPIDDLVGTGASCTIKVLYYFKRPKD